MQLDLQTKLDWAAVDHHNTGHSHSHILVRGITDQGKTLNITGDYLAHGVRQRAGENMTPELVLSTELDATDKLRHEVDAERFARLNRMLMAGQRPDGII
ncbi:MAG: hypothetical protein RIC24_09080 [Hyphomicrobiales bacterium]|jgi:type IV secretory pathway VirD2 relaxase